MERGWNPKLGAFTQHYDTEVLDSSLLMMPLQGFIAPRHPMWPIPLRYHPVGMSLRHRAGGEIESW